MTKKIQIIEVREYVYEPDPDDYADYENVNSVEEMLELDKKDVARKAIKLEDLVQETTVVGRTWRIIDEP